MPDYAPSIPTQPAHADSSVRPLVVFLNRPDGTTVPAPYLLSTEDVADLFRLRESGCRFYKAAVNPTGGWACSPSAWGGGSGSGWTTCWDSWIASKRG